MQRILFSLCALALLMSFPAGTYPAETADQARAPSEIVFYVR
ncbi:MAG: hypothetical protein PVG49_15085 [Desulfobacteraceae bacterium]|jgi:hypothetical protein